MPSSFSVFELVEYLHRSGQTNFNPETRPEWRNEMVRGAAQDRRASRGELSWISERVARTENERISSFRGSLLVVPVSEGIDDLPNVVPCHNPKSAFAGLVIQFFGSTMHVAWPRMGGHIIATDALIGERVSLAPGVVLGSGVRLGNDVKIGPNTCIANVEIADNVEIGSNCSIGLSGFGYERDGDGTYHRFPHLGAVVIEERVEIGSNVCIDRGSLGETRIGAGSKIDNLVHIAHNVTIGKNVMVIANSMIGGSAVIEDGVWLAPSSSILNQLRVGPGAVVGMGAVVIRSVDQDTTVVGNPSKVLHR